MRRVARATWRQWADERDRRGGMTGETWSRRTVLASAASLAVSACSPALPRRGRQGSTKPPLTGDSQTGRSAGVTDAEWRALARSLTGRLVRPGDPSYSSAHELYDPRFDHVRPAGVVQAASPDDVSQAVTFAAHHPIALHLRAGGHSYLGASTGPGLVVD